MNNRFAVGDKLELLGPEGTVDFELRNMETETGETREVAPGNGHVVRIPLPEGAPVPAEPRFAMLARYL